jgi:TetR/AcrR family transcriptional regulator, cholesterol catabolism regulator
MASRAIRYTAAFKQQMVDLVRSGRTPMSLAKEFGVTPVSISMWLKQDARGEGKGRLTGAGREDPTRLLRESPKVKEERDLVQGKSIRKRQRILDAAAKILSVQGYTEANLSDIAAEIGIHAGSLYYYFPSREDLVREVLHIAIRHMEAMYAEVLDVGDKGSTPLDRIREFIAKVLTQRVSKKNDFILAYLRNANQVLDKMPELAQERRKIMRRVRRVVARMVSEAKEAGEISADIDSGLTALYIVGATNWVAAWYDPTGTHTVDQISDNFTELLIHGMVGARIAGKDARARRSGAAKKG